MVITPLNLLDLVITITVLFLVWQGHKTIRLLRQDLVPAQREREALQRSVQALHRSLGGWQKETAWPAS
jgi:FtsZ-binding cell division protein ZapB